MRTRSAALLVLLLAALLVIASVSAGLATANTGDDETRIPRESVTVAHGGFADIPMLVPDGTEATVLLQRTTNAVTSRATVQDDGDGRIVLRLNTYTGEWQVRDASDRIVSQDTNRDRAVRPDTYTLGVDTPTGAARTQITVEPDALDRLTTWQTSDPNRSFENASMVRSAIESGSLVRAESVTRNDTLVLQVDASGLAGMLADTSGENSTARFRSLFESRGTLRMVQTYPPPELMPATVPLLNETSVRVLDSGAEGTYYVLVDLTAVHVYRGDHHDDDFRFEDASFAVSVGLDRNESVGEDGERLDAFVDDRRARLAYGTQVPLEFRAAPNQTFDGLTTVGAGRNVTVVVRSADDTDTARNESFVRASTTTVQSIDDRNENGFHATVNLTGVPRGTDATVTIRFQNHSILRQPIDARITTQPTTTTNAATTTASTTGTALPDTTTRTTTPTDTTVGRTPAPGPAATGLAVLVGLVLHTARGRH